MDTAIRAKEFLRVRAKGLLFTLLALVLSCIGCGGGTTGTDGGVPVKLEGIVLSSKGIPVVKAKITLLQTGDITETNDRGDFLITTEVVDEMLDLEVEVGRSRTTLALGEAPSDSSIIQLKITVFDSPKNIALAALSIAPVDPSPMPSPSPSASVSPGPGSTPTPAVAESVLNGIVEDNLGNRLSGVQISIENAGSAATSDNGQFEIPFASGLRRLVLVFKQSEYNATVVIDGLPSYPIEITARFELSLVKAVGSNSVGVNSIDPSGSTSGLVMSVDIREKRIARRFKVQLS